ncbi:MAG: hypothetical protein ACE37F_37115 [Nannocystaceae bacterium]|nr:PDZ domain-containing protein [bacterium]
MKARTYALSALLSVPLLPSAACGLFEDDQPPGAPGGTGGQPGGGDSCSDQFDGFDPALLQDVCPTPYAPQYTVNIGGADILWIDDPANATTVGLGWVFGNTAQADWLGWIAQGDQQCGIACTLPQGHPCNASNDDDSQGTYCFGGSDAAECIYCSAADHGPEACGDFVESCAGALGGGGVGDETGDPDSTSGGGGVGDVTGAADSGSGGAGAGGLPGDSLFTSNPDVIFGTTQEVLDLYGNAAPPNLVAEDICAVWDPQAAVNDWFGDSLLKKEALQQTLREAEMFLGYCDNLKLEMADDGIKLLSFESRSLADELGFEEGDIILSLNGVRATDPLALQNELVELSHASPGLAVIKYRRSGTIRTHRVRVE